MIVIASSNSNKIKEFRNIIPNIDFVLAKDLGINIDVDENGNDYYENARIKCLAISKLVNCPVIADDSGLEVESLPDILRVHTARFRNDLPQEKRNQCIIDMLVDKPNRNAAFACCVVMVLPDGKEYSSFKKMYGKISEKIRGEGGFGYDPIFIPNGYDLTFAELPQNQKDIISHRGLALTDLFTQLSKEFIKEHCYD